MNNMEINEKAEALLKSKDSISLFVVGYLEAALWTGDEEDGIDKKAIIDINPDSIIMAIDDCRKFLDNEENCNAIDKGVEYEGMTFSHAGHDFWLTRNGHGSGFWDGDWEEEDGKLLTEASESFGGSWLTLGDDGMVHIM